MNGAENQAGKYLTFHLGKEEYGISITKVKEIIGMMKIINVPQREVYMKGVINLRDKIIPVIDTRLRFNLEEVESTDRTCIIVTEVQSLQAGRCWQAKQCGKEGCPAYGSRDHRCWMISGTHCRDEIQGSFHEKIEACRKCNFYEEMKSRRSVFTLGLVVDSVSEVVNIKEEQIEAPPNFGSRVDSGSILGMAKMNDGVKILLNIDRIFNNDVLEQPEPIDKAA